MEYKSNNNIVYSCKYHVVWCPKYRRKVLVGTISERLKEVIKQKCSEIKVDIIEMEIMPDHVHLLIEVDPQFGINKAIRSIKGYTSYTLRKGVQRIDNAAAVALDEQLFRIYRWWRVKVRPSAVVVERHKKVYRKPNNVAKAGGQKCN